MQKREASKHTLVLALSILLILNVINSSFRAKAATTPTVYVDPALTLTSSEATFSVNISVAEVTDLCSWQLFMYFKNDIVNATACSEGPFLKSQGSTTFDKSINNIYNATHGELWMYCLRTWSGGGVNGSGTLGTVTFKAGVSGNSSLNLANTILGNASARRIYHITTDGVVIIGIHDVAVTNVAPSKTIVGEGLIVYINVTAENQGNYTETFNVTTKANTTAIQILTVTNLTSGSSTTMTFTWNTTGFAYGNYTISASAEFVPYEIDIDDNNLTDDTVIVTIPGDFSGDFKVGPHDFALLAAAYGSTPWQPGPSGDWNPNCDANNDNKVGPYDFAVLSVNYGNHYP